MNLLHIVVIFQIIFQVYGQDFLVCQKEVWLPADEPPHVSDGCEPYDGSLVPDCKYFLNNYTSYFHVHEYDCGYFWECSPSGPCLMKCADCPVSPQCPEGLLEFDCRYQYPNGPVCDWPDAVNCTNDTPCDITQVECCSEYDCQAGELCIGGSCVKPSSTAKPTTTQCPNECCSNADCEDGYLCTIDGTCKCATQCCADSDCDNGFICDSGSCKCPNECCADSDCEDGFTCDADGVCKCPTECCVDEDCPEGYNCDADGSCKCPTECCSDDDCNNGLTCAADGTCSCPTECCSDDDCESGFTCDVNGSCQCPTECCTDEDCENGTTCDANGSCTCPTECCSDDDCSNGMTCDVNGSCQCPTECCSDDDCNNGMTCDVNGSCQCPTECCSDDDCENGLTCDVNGSCKCPNECCSDDDCEPGYMCTDDGTCTAKGECGLDRPCDLANGICDEVPYTTCEWCNYEDNTCNPGCDSDDNCGDHLICTSHFCQEGPGVNGIVNITIKTETCNGCAGSGDPLGVIEGGVQLYLKGGYGTECNSNGLDNNELVDYKNGRLSFFDGKPDDDGSDDGMGECKGADMNYKLEGGTATWTGPGEWTGAASSPICIKFFDPLNNKPTCCCDLAQRNLNILGVDTTDLVNCSCEV